MNNIRAAFLKTIFPPRSDSKQLTSISPSYEVDFVAAYNSFIKHWQDIVRIFEETTFRKVSTDDVTAVTILSDQMINLLLIDLRRMTSNGNPLNGAAANHKPNMVPISATPIFDHFLGERILQKILQWSVSLTSKEFLNALQLHLLKIFETLLSHSHPEILVYKPLTEPLLLLLESCSECGHLEIEKRLVVLLNQLWVSVIHNQHLLKYFLLFYEDRPPKFVIFSLLLPFIHREGGVGQQARDALLLSLSLSASHYGVAEFIIRHSDFCPVVATGLSGLYSMLPRSLNITVEGWYRLSAKDVACTPPLQMFFNSLGFCNATVQVSHLQIQQQLVDFLYHGFLIPVVGRALIQNVVEELIAAIAYIDFFLRSVTEEKLRRAFLALLLSPQEYSELPLLTSIISHLHSPVVQLNLVTLNLFNTLLQLHSEDVMTVLVFQYLAPCNHVMLSQRSKLSQPPFTAADRFLRLLPNVCKFESLASATSPTSQTGSNSINQSSFSVYLEEAKSKVALSYNACKSWTWAYDAQSPSPTDAVHLITASKIIPVNPYTKVRVHSDPTSYSLPYENNGLEPATDKKRSMSLPSFVTKDSSFSSSKRRQSIVARTRDTTGWNSAHLTEEDRLDSLGESSGYESNPKNSGHSSPLHTTRTKPQSENGLTDSSSRDEEENVQEFLTFLDSQTKTDASQDEDALQFIDYFYFAVERTPTSRKSENLQIASQEDSDLQNQWLSLSATSTEEDSNEEKPNSISSHPKPTIGPFLEGLIAQLDNMFTSNVDASLVAMNCLSCLASYPCPLLTSLLLQPSVVLQPAVRSLYQVLGRLKHNIDKVLTSQDDLPALLDARDRLYGSLKSEIKKPVMPNPVTTGWNFFKKKGGILATGSGYHYISPTQDTPSPFLNVSIEKRQATICAILLKEWLLELAALAQEHTVCSPVIRFRFVPTTSR